MSNLSLSLSLSLSLLCRSQIEVENRNHDESELEASGIENALAALSIGLMPQRTTSGNAAAAAAAAQAASLNGGSGAHVTLKVFENQRMPFYKAEKPGLKMSQYRELIRKEWQRSKLNPANADK